MPSSTFEHLNNDKKIRIFDAAVNEFAENGILTASVSRIVKKSKIATGSFYQYFDDIEDLFFYVAIEIANKKTEYMKRELDKVNTKDFEEVIKAIYKGGIEFANDNKNLCKIANHISQIKDTPLYSKLMNSMPKTNIYEYLTPLIDDAKANGQIRKDMDITLFFLVVNSINMAVLDYMASLNEDGKFDYSNDDLDKFSKLALNLLLNGIK